jgi:hypothetical protein
MPVPKLKSYLLVLANYLNLAPCEEDALPLQGFISSDKKGIEREVSWTGATTFLQLDLFSLL